MVCVRWPFSSSLFKHGAYGGFLKRSPELLLHRVRGDRMVLPHELEDLPFELAEVGNLMAHKLLPQVVLQTVALRPVKMQGFATACLGRGGA